MGERVIGVWHVGGPGKDEILPDPSAPSLSEVVRELRHWKQSLADMIDATAHLHTPQDHPTVANAKKAHDRVADLVSRLEGKDEG